MATLRNQAGGSGALPSAPTPASGPARLGVAKVNAAVHRRPWLLIIVAFTILAVLIAAFSVQTFRASGDRREAERWHVHTLEVLLAARKFRSGAFAGLRSERGYLLTGGNGFLEDFRKSEQDATRALQRLRGLMADNPRQLRNLDGVEHDLHAYFAVLEQAIRFAREGRHDAALAIVRGGAGQSAFAALEASIGQVEAEEESLLISRRQALDQAALQMERLGYMAALLTLMLLAFAAQAAIIALKEKKRADLAADELRRLATTDELTGLANRRLFFERVEEELARSRRSGAPLCLATIDVDHFKAVNDRHGHPAGDFVLRRIAETVRDNIRLGDIAGRLGGEEFGILLPATDLEAARMVCDRIRQAVGAHLLALPSGTAIPVTLSAGVAALASGETVEALAARSDAALYAAKSAGRNRVLLAA